MSFGSLEFVGSLFVGLPSLEPETGPSLEPCSYGSLASAVNPIRNYPSFESFSTRNLAGLTLSQQIIAHVAMQREMSTVDISDFHFEIIQEEPNIVDVVKRNFSGSKTLPQSLK